MAALFNLSKPLTGSVGTTLWIDLGLIPVGYNFWIGTWTCTNPSKAISYYLYTNLVGKGISGAVNCKQLGTLAPKSGGTATQDLYRKGALHTATVKGTGVEHWWVCLASKSSTLGTYRATISYTQE